MEDHNQSWKKSKSADKESIVELSKDMESPDQTKHKIIDLTLEMDSSEDKAQAKPAKEMIQEKLSDTPEPAEEKSPAAMVNETTDSVEEEVDAAFDAVQMQPIESTATKADNALFDELSDITQQVDDAVSRRDTNTSSDENPLPPIEPVPLDNDTLAADAAELDVAMAGDDDDDPTDQTDVALNGEDELSDAFEVEDNDDIIELVDVVESTELADLGTTTPQEDDEIIELTDIVDPAEVESLGIDTQQKKKAAEADLPDPLDDAESTDTGLDPVEEELTLSESDIDGDVDLFTDIDAGLATEQDAFGDLAEPFDAAELDTLFDNDNIAQEEAGLDIEPQADDIDTDSAPAPQEEQDFLGDPDESFDAAELDTLFDDDDIAQEEADFAIEPQTDDTDTDDAPALQEEGDHQEQVIQLADVLRASNGQSSPATEFQADEEDHRAHQLVSRESQDTSDALDSSLNQASEIDNESDEDKKIEAAVEHVIQTKYADTIEQLIANEVEKAVMREIENIKRTLSEDDEPLQEP